MGLWRVSPKAAFGRRQTEQSKEREGPLASPIGGEAGDAKQSQGEGRFPRRSACPACAGLPLQTNAVAPAEGVALNAFAPDNSLVTDPVGHSRLSWLTAPSGRIYFLLRNILGSGNVYIPSVSCRPSATLNWRAGGLTSSEAQRRFSTSTTASVASLTGNTLPSASTSTGFRGPPSRRDSISCAARPPFQPRR